MWEDVLHGLLVVGGFQAGLWTLVLGAGWLEPPRGDAYRSWPAAWEQGAGGSATGVQQAGSELDLQADPGELGRLVGVGASQRLEDHAQ